MAVSFDCAAKTPKRAPMPILQGLLEFNLSARERSDLGLQCINATLLQHLDVLWLLRLEKTQKIWHRCNRVEPCFSLNSYNSRYQQVAIPTEPASKDLFKKKSCQVPSEQDTCTKEGTPLNIDINTYKLEAGKISPDKQSVDKMMVQPSSKLNTSDFHTLSVN